MQSTYQSLFPFDEIQYSVATRTPLSTRRFHKYKPLVVELHEQAENLKEFTNTMRVRLLRLQKRDRRVLASTVKGISPSQRMTPIRKVLHNRGSLKSLRFLLLICDVAINEQSLDKNDDETLLYEACYFCDDEIVEFFLERGADVDQLGGWYQCPLNVACSRQDLELAELLLSYGASTSIRTRGGETCIDLVSQNIPLIELLVKYGADINSTKTSVLQNEDWTTEEIEKLFSMGADPHRIDNLGHDYLKHMACEGDDFIVWWLCSRIFYHPMQKIEAFEILTCSLLLRGEPEEKALLCWKEANNLSRKACLPVFLPAEKWSSVEGHIHYKALKMLQLLMGPTNPCVIFKEIEHLGLIKGGIKNIANSIQNLPVYKNGDNLADILWCFHTYKHSVLSACGAIIRAFYSETREYSLEYLLGIICFFSDILVHLNRSLKELMSVSNDNHHLEDCGKYFCEMFICLVQTYMEFKNDASDELHPTIDLLIASNVFPFSMPLWHYTIQDVPFVSECDAEIKFFQNHNPVLELFLSRGVDVDAISNTTHMSALYLAVLEENFDAAYKLIDHGAYLDFVMPGGQTVMSILANPSAGFLKPKKKTLRGLAKLNHYVKCKVPSMKCLAARAMAKQKKHMTVPIKSLDDFVKQHRLEE